MQSPCTRLTRSTRERWVFSFLPHAAAMTVSSQPFYPAVPPISLELTNRCNLKCPYCANGTLTRPSGTIAWSLLERLVDQCAGGPKQIDWLHGTGEPLLGCRLEDVIRLIRGRNAGAVSFATNATLLTADRVGRRSPPARCPTSISSSRTTAGWRCAARTSTSCIRSATRTSTASRRSGSNPPTRRSFAASARGSAVALSSARRSATSRCRREAAVETSPSTSPIPSHDPLRERKKVPFRDTVRNSYQPRATPSSR